MINIAAFRPGAQPAFACIEERICRGEKYNALIAPCRYGKSDFQRVLAVKLWMDGVICCTVALSPTAYLRDQLVNRRAMEDAVTRYNLPPFSYTAMRNMTPNFAPNGEAFVSATTQLIHLHLDIVLQWIEHMIRTTGLPPLFTIDEAHTVGGENEWGRAVQAMVNAGAVVLLLTATASRADGTSIPGFRYEVLSSQSGTRTTVATDASDPELWRVTVQETEEQVVRLIADAEITFKQAWNESVLCGLTHFGIDCRVTIARGEKSRISLLSELSPTEVRQYLGSIVRQPDAIEIGVQRLLEQLHSLKTKYDPDCAAIIFCANDSGDMSEETNKHAKEIEAAVHRLASFALKTKIVTNADGKEGPGRLREFVKGENDILIVKQMAGMGMDVPRVKIVLDLSPVRTYAACVQRWARCLTPFLTRSTGVLRAASLISPMDCIGRGYFAVLTEGMGDQDRIVQVGDLLAEYVIEKREEPPARVQMLATDFEHTDFVDHDGIVAYADEYGDVRRFVDGFPLVGARYTAPYIAQTIRQFREGPPEREDIQDTGELATRLRREANSLTHKIRLLLFGAMCSREQMEEQMRQVWKNLYRRARVRIGKHLREINDLEDLKRICDTARTIIRELSRDGCNPNDFFVEDDA